MTTQIVFNIDRKIKAKAMKRAKSAGVPFAVFLKMATEAFAEGQYRVGIISREIPNAKTAREIASARADFKKGKNISPAFTSGKKMDAYLGI
ncbi:MAG TPA: hypothetical protein VJJ24_00785 [Candidatus Paceibacterota bacterium]